MKTTAPATLPEWRQWLSENHKRETEVWLTYHKKHTGKSSVSYEDSVQEALCWGWIDSLIKRMDDDRYARKFTPRKPDSQWSVSNIKRVRKLKKENRLQPAGRGVIPEKVFTGKIANREPDTQMCSEFSDALAANEVARQNFERMTEKQQNLFVRWINAAKQTATRQKRSEEAIKLLNEGKKLGMK